MAFFEAYTKTPAEIGSFLSSRYENLAPVSFSVSDYGTAGSVLVVVHVK